ncbi:MAG: fasciclin domain-containing protein [Chloroflexota bacterium]
MRKIFVLMAFVMLMPFSSVFADGHVMPIADTVIALAEGDEPEFTTLLTAIQAADPAVLEVLADPEAELTVFAPTDAAFAALAEALGEEAFGALLEDTATLTAILRYHVVPGAVMSADVVAGLEESMMEDDMMGSSFFVSTAQGIRAEVAQEGEDEPITVGGAPLNLEMLDVAAANGVIHVVDAVMVPPLETIADVVVASTEADEPEFTTLLAAVGAADPSVLELLADPASNITVFAPTDEAFAALGEDTIAAVVADMATVTGILQYHVLPGVVYSDQVVELVADGPVSVEMADGNTAEVTPELTIAGAGIVTTDIETINGVIHVIDAVILPPEGE